VTDRAGDVAFITARDCSPISIGGREEDEWLRKLARAAKPAELLLQIGRGGDVKDDEPVVSFDSMSGTWWAGRYVGEVQFEDRTLRLEPRFGMPSLMRWLATIWGVRVVDSKGRFERQRIWLWLVIAHLWAGRLVAAAKHGLPYRRIDSIHSGRALRGKLLTRDTALARALSDDQLVSLTRIRVIDPSIGSILLAAFERLTGALGAHDAANYWLPDRAKAVVDDLRSALGSRAATQAIVGRAQVRYSPMTETYRAAVDLSLSILARQPSVATSGGESKAFGILLDMAEIWELYIAKLLQIGVPGLHVSHAGRTSHHFRWLLETARGSNTFGSLRPDILIFDHRDRCLAIADAKYKTTRISAHNRTGVIREDLYQLNAYLSGFAEPGSRLDAFLIYPDDADGQVASHLAPKNPWKVVSAPKQNFWFLTVNCEPDATDATLTVAEQSTIQLIRSTIAPTD
jgi:5-methylcytosine-specific restriction enzyme subunit McrC